MKAKDSAPKWELMDVVEWTLEKAHEEIRSRSRRKIPEHAEECPESPAMQSRCQTCFQTPSTGNSSAADTPIAKGWMAEDENFQTTSPWAFCRRWVPTRTSHLYLNSQKCTSYAVMPSLQGRPHGSGQHGQGARQKKG